MTIVKFQLMISRRLLIWGILSVILGRWMQKRGGFWHYVGSQFVAWGAIDGAIAVGGQLLADQRMKNTPPNEMSERLRKDKRNLKIALWVNAFLDVFYVIGGLRWMKHSNKDSAKRGNGFGVIIQGLFLLWFDLYHSFKIQDVEEGQDT